MKSIEEAKRLIIAEKLKHYNERLADMERDLQFFYEESTNDKESLDIIQDMKEKVEQLKEVKNKENHETVF
ncbi:hypothetical protein ACQKDD_11270 [Planococcus kocurii]|uniref:Uncharacterized protein n=1 Tax=Planococcus kocurii TaxID=1374 RepID=A0ABN4JZA8_9BACL|nr:MULTISPECIES: hypothetical protein [Planococcus]ALS79687.1 hypothetical protein AUO94_14100 [Planococcus kocurii]KAA0955322.1 hypothetical protein FQ085_15455 [Planococcus sp. ANT_H30]